MNVLGFTGASIVTALIIAGLLMLAWVQAREGRDDRWRAGR